jgi:hypothetical protein
MPRRLFPYILAILALVAPARAQDQGAGEVGVRVQWVGVGGRVRPGDWAGIRLLLSDSGDRSREVLVRIGIPDADGDRVIYERATTTNPGVPQPLWVYLRVPMRFRVGDVLNVYIHEALERGAGAAAPGEREGWGAGRVLGSKRILSSSAEGSDSALVQISPADSVIGIVGQQRMGLDAYEGDRSSGSMPYGHEKTFILDGLTPEGLPDRWMGYAPFDAIVWNEPPPASLGTEGAQALREWVLRGGHLVVVLPRIGETWTNEASNPLYDITPRVRVVRHEGIDLSAYRLLFTRQTGELKGSREILQTFAALPNSDPAEAVCILRGPAPAGHEGECLVVRRPVGCGAVTLVGLDASSNFMRLNGRKGITLPEAELFWHRVLGRRGRVTIPEDESAGFVRGGLGRDELALDGDISAQIAKTGIASSGVFAGFVVFVAYWLVAGPLGYAVLSRTGRRKHAWVAFVLASGAFTAIAWGGARAIRPASIETSHLTFLDHVFGQDTERARSWVSLLVPEYGTAAVSVGDSAKAANTTLHNAVVPWDSEESGGEGFPDARTYRIESRDPRQITIPTRATVKQFQVDWAGGTGWQMPRPRAQADGSPGIVRVVRTPGERVKEHLEGVLVHQLPGTLSEVWVVVNYGQKGLARSFTGAGAANLTADIGIFKLTSDWQPGQPLDLSSLESEERVSDTLDRLTSGALRAGALDPSPARVATRMTALALFPQLNPPDADSARGGRWNVDAEPLARRRFSHGYDLGRWFTRPSIMIIGQLTGGTPSPVPVFVSTGGPFHEAPSKGRTVVRWVYPLPEHAPAYVPRTDGAPTDEGPAAEPEPENP